MTSLLRSFPASCKRTDILLGQVHCINICKSARCLIANEYFPVSLIEESKMPTPSRLLTPKTLSLFSFYLLAPHTTCYIFIYCQFVKIVFLLTVGLCGLSFLYASVYESVRTFYRCLFICLCCVGIFKLIFHTFNGLSISMSLIYLHLHWSN